MANAKTEHSKKLRSKSARETEARVIAAGGKRISVLLKPDAAAALQRERERTASSVPAIIHRLILENMGIE